jgi:hypothetical protein
VEDDDPTNLFGHDKWRWYPSVVRTVLVFLFHHSQGIFATHAPATFDEPIGNPQLKDATKQVSLQHQMLACTDITSGCNKYCLPLLMNQLSGKLIETVP